MKILLVYPEFLVTFWSWKHLLKFVSKKAAFPPLGLLTVAAMLPRSWEVRLVDVNATKLTDEDIRWANYVFISAITTQKDSAERVISRCNKIKTPVVLGGPILEMGYEFKGVRSFLRGEVEETLLDFLADLKSSGLEREYSQRGFPDLALSPIPLWELINCKDYACMLVQYGRGCPYKCTFCNVAALNGRTPRAKSPEKFLEELEAIYKTGFRGPIMFADDNFIGNKSRVKEMLPLLARWQRDHKYPFDFTVEVDITIAGDSELMTMMVLAGFKKVFLGLETPNYDALVECHKFQNTKCDMEASIRILQNHGLHPMSGFIIGFDSDGPDIFDKHIDFYQRTGIVFPMVGVLQAPIGTAIHEKLSRAGRLSALSSGNNTDCCPNFVTKMPLDTLVEGYKRVMRTVYSPKNYFERIRVFLREYRADKRVVGRITINDLRAFCASVWRIGIFGGLETSYYYWRTLLLAFFKHPKAFSEAVALQIYGWHFQKIAASIQKDD